MKKIHKRLKSETFARIIRRCLQIQACLSLGHEIRKPLRRHDWRRKLRWKVLCLEEAPDCELRAAQHAILTNPRMTEAVGSAAAEGAVPLRWASVSVWPIPAPASQTPGRRPTAKEVPVELNEEMRVREEKTASRREVRLRRDEEIAELAALLLSDHTPNDWMVGFRLVPRGTSTSRYQLLDWNKALV